MRGEIIANMALALLLSAGLFTGAYFFFTDHAYSLAGIFSLFGAVCLAVFVDHWKELQK